MRLKHFPMYPHTGKDRSGNDLLVDSVGASPKPGPTVGRPFMPPGLATMRLALDASSRRTRTEAGTMDVTVLSSCSPTPTASPFPHSSHACLP